jgi:hypothetical protein
MDPSQLYVIVMSINCLVVGGRGCVVVSAAEGRYG